MERSIRHKRKVAKTRELNQLKKKKTSGNKKHLGGWYVLRIRNADIDIIKTNQLLKNTGLKVRTEGLIIEERDQNQLIRNYRANNILKMNQI